ncbi:MAG: hypothetical protein U0Q16_00920 [Bryobacteraceae bacterium]
MRLCVFLLAACALAQNSSQLTSYTYDVNGNRVQSSQQSASGAPGGYTQSNSVNGLNGAASPRQAIEERVVSEGPGGRIVERTIRRFDTFGNPAFTERQRIEDRVATDGSSVRAITIYDGDLNGQFQLRFRETSQTRKESEQLTRVNTTVERPDPNGRLDFFEKRQTVINGDQAKDFKKDTTIYRKDTNGILEAQEREVMQVSTRDSQKTANTATYRTIATGKMELWEQKVARTSVAADGSETEVTDVYAAVAGGRADGKGPQLREQQITEKKRNNGGYTESVSIRQTALDSSKLGPPQKISETVCKGKCQ